MNKVYAPTDCEFRKVISSASGYSDCLRELGLDPAGGTSSKLLKRRIRELGLDVSHFKGRRGSRPKRPLSEILVKNSTHTNIYSLKKRLVRENVLEYKCVCGLTSEWQGRKLVLQLDHVNGDSSDHRIENLRFLCPNCHSQTDTFCGRNRAGC